MAALVAVGLAACGSDDDASNSLESTAPPTQSADTSPETVATEPPADPTVDSAADTVSDDTPPDTAADVDAMRSDLVAAAEEEGTVMAYSSQAPASFEALVAGFQAKYPNIKVETFRAVDAEFIPRVETEQTTGTPGADIWISTVPDWAASQAAAGQCVDPSASPALSGLTDYDIDLYLRDGNYFIVGASIITLAWNTDLVPDGLTDYPDLLDPSLAGGKIGTSDPSVSAIQVDFYEWLRETYGDDFLEKLAAQDVVVYPGASPIAAALGAGEIYAAAYGSAAALTAAKADGAPVDFVIPENVWGAPFYACVAASGDSPNAGTLFADYLVSPEGQELVAVAGGTVIPGTPGAVASMENVHQTNLDVVQPDYVANFLDEFNSLFVS